MRDIGVGVVGCGFVGRGAHVPAFSSIEGARLVAAADPDTKRLSKVADKYQVDSTYQDYADLVADPDVQAVVVAAPTPLHAEASLAAIRAGKHVLCEMPLVSNLELADEIIEAADKQGVLLMPGLTFRFTPSFVKAKETMARGEFGAALAFSYREFIPARDLANQWPAGSWVWNVAESGGPLYTLSVWSIDLVRWLFDTEIAEVWGAAKYSRLDKFEGTLGYDASATLKLANGVVGCLQYSGSVAGSAAACALEIIGDRTQVLRANENHSLMLFGEEPAETKWNVKQSGAGMWGHLQQDEHFIRCIRDGQRPQITPADGRKAMEVALRIAQPASEL